MLPYNQPHHIMSFCPCLDCLFKAFSGSKNKKDKTRDYEEETFINQYEEQPLDDTISPPSQPSIKQQRQKVPPPPKEEPSLEEDNDLLNVKMDLNSGTRPSQEGPNQGETKDIQDLIQEELNLTPQEAVEHHAQKKQPKEELYQVMGEEAGQQGFTINLDPLDPFFNILHEKTSNLSELLLRTGENLDVGEPNRAGLRVELLNNNRMTTIIARYSVGCSYSYYLSLIKNEKVNASFSAQIVEMKVIEAFKPNLTRNTLKFKRLGSFQAREVGYVKYQNSSKREHWEIYIQDEKAEVHPNYKTCQMFCGKQIKEESKQLLIKEYLQIDLQSSNASSILPKLVGEYRNYLNKMIAHIQANYEQETA